MILTRGFASIHAACASGRDIGCCLDWAEINVLSNQTDQDYKKFGASLMKTAIVSVLSFLVALMGFLFTAPDASAQKLRVGYVHVFDAAIVARDQRVVALLDLADDFQVRPLRRPSNSIGKTQDADFELIRH